MALGPFEGSDAYLRWAGERLAWGAGDLSGKGRVFFTLGLDGTTQGLQIPADCYPVVPVAPAGPGCLAVRHRPEAGLWEADETWLLPLEGRPVRLGRSHRLFRSSSRNWLLLSGPDGTVLYDTRTWAATDMPAIPSDLFPAWACDIGNPWVDDSLVVIRQPGLQKPPGQGLQLVRMPEGCVTAEVALAGQYLSPLPSPDGRWVAVLLIDAQTAWGQEDARYPYDAGQEIRVYARADLWSPDPPVAARLLPPDGMATSLVWSPDGSRLAYASVKAVTGDFGPAFEGPSRVIVATGPGFKAREIPLDPSRVWMPSTFSPGGSCLALQEAGGDDGSLFWDFTAEKAVALPSNLHGFKWMGEGLVGTTEEGRSPGEQQLVFVRVASGEATRNLPWPVEWWDWSPAGYVAAVVEMEAGGELGPLGRVAAGRWLVLLPAAQEP